MTYKSIIQVPSHLSLETTHYKKSHHDVVISCSTPRRAAPLLNLFRKKEKDCISFFLSQREAAVTPIMDTVTTMYHISRWNVICSIPVSIRRQQRGI